MHLHFQMVGWRLAPFHDWFSVLCNIVLGFEVEEGVGLICTCREGICDMRCTECFPCTITCKSCFLRTHQHQPFHWAHCWNSRYFEKTDFATLGGVLYLGHGRSPCNLRDSRHTRRIIITHTNGVHESNVSFCVCVGSSEQWEQLMRQRLFPATFTSPRARLLSTFSNSLT
jgi:hypothetical protein